MDEDNNNLEEKFLNPATKAILALAGTILSALIVSTWNTVNNSSLDIVRLQGRTNTIEERVTELKNVDQERIRELNIRMTNLEARTTVLEKDDRKGGNQ